VCLASLATQLQAANILVNPGFEANSGNNVPVGWTYFMPPSGSGASYWIDNAGNAQHSGALYWKQWGIFWDAARTNVAGIYQDFNSAIGSVYQANGWFYTLSSDQMGPNNIAWIDVSFRDASGQLLALYKSDDFSTSVGVNEWFQFHVTNATDITKPVPTGDPSLTMYAVTGTVSQIVAPLGTKTVRYRFCFTQGGGWPEGGGAVYFDDAVLDQVSGPLPPIIGSLSPVNMIFYAPSNGLTFTASSPSGTTISNSSIQVVLNGVNVSSNLTITGSDSTKSVAYYGLESNLVYNASIQVTDAFGFSASAATYFETTWVGVPPVVLMWEAEDFDYTNGMYINNPELCSAAGNPNCYFGKVGTEGVDEHSVDSSGDHIYRADDLIATTGSGDFARKELVDAGRGDYKVGWFNSGEWVNYTRDWPSGTYWVIARVANGGGSGTLTFSRVNPDTTTTDLGTFTLENGRGWTTYDSVFLRDTNGNIATVTFSGNQTYRATTSGNIDMGLFMLVAGQVDLPLISALTPSGRRPFEYTNALSFNVTSQGGVISPQNIRLSLNGVDVSSDLQVTGTPSSRSVLYPTLGLNAMYRAVITVTNDSGIGAAITNMFDTFSESNLIVQAEDFDFDMGKFIDNPEPEAFLSVADSVAEYDFHHTVTTDDRYVYRAVGIPQQITSDYRLQKYSDVGATDYNLGWFNGGEWANYTRTYPSGKFRVYGRLAGSGEFTVYLDRVVSGAGTTNQVTERLGRFSEVGKDWQVWDWVLLTDAGLESPTVVNLNGLSTLRITTGGNANVNYLMLVPASGLTVGARLVAGAVQISFPSQAGATYRVLYRNQLGSGSWELLKTVVGNGALMSVSDSPTQSNRFYQVVSP
jgi:hypothetical protein